MCKCENNNVLTRQSAVSTLLFWEISAYLHLHIFKFAN